MRKIGGVIADLGTRIDGHVGNVTVQDDLKALRDKTESASHAMKKVVATNKAQADGVMQNLVDSTKDMGDNE